MDLRNLVNDEKPTQSDVKPEIQKRHSTISDLVNQEDIPITNNTNTNTSSPLSSSMRSPVLLKQTAPQPNATPAINTIKARSSISSLTNDTDVDVDGKITPSIARRLSYEFGSQANSTNNSPVLSKKSISRAPSLQNMINVDEPIEFEEPEYNERDTTSKEQEEESQRTSVSEARKQLVKHSPSPRPPSRSTPLKQEQQNADSQQHEQQQPHHQTKKDIEEELATLKTIEKADEEKPKKYKPKRYSKPPIWAQKWQPNFKPSNNNQINHSNSRFARSDPNNKHDVSITGVKPYNDITRRITGWIYAQIHNIPIENRQLLELEVKFGRIWEKQTDRRIHIPVTNECIVDQNYMNGCSFKPGLDKDHYEKSKKFLTGLTKLHKEKFKTLKSDQIDRIFRDVSRGQEPRYYRITTDKATNRLEANIEKRKLGNLHIHCPDLIFDYRLTMSIEIPSNQNPERFANQTPESERHKKRQSIFHESTASRFDITQVITKPKSKNDNEVESLELEIEIDMFQLVNAFDNLDKDQFTFEELSETFLDNARIINRELIKPGPK